MRAFFSSSLFFLFLLSTLFFFPSSALAETPLLTYEKNGEILGVLSPDMPSLGALAIGDLGSDGVSEIIASTGYGVPTRIFALRKDGSTIGSFFPYDPQFVGGASVRVCDLDRDGLLEIITGAGFSGGPHVRVFENDGSPSPVNFFAYDPSFLGGVFVHCLDITGDGKPEIVTTPGATGGPHVKVFSAQGLLLDELFLSDLPHNSGFTLSSPPLSDGTFYVVPYAREVTSSVTLRYAHNELVEDSRNTHTSSSPILFSQSVSSHELTTHITSAYERIEGDTYHLHSPSTTPLLADMSPKSIVVDISSQKLTAYEYGIPAFSFLVSTGIASHPTPLGRTTVSAKLPVHDYVWYYGANHPSNYNIPGVKWNLRFRQHYYIHSAYWHNNFGVRMSHGCVNTSVSDAEKIFSWADVGTPVEIVP